LGNYWEIIEMVFNKELNLAFFGVGEFRLDLFWGMEQEYFFKVSVNFSDK